MATYISDNPNSLALDVLVVNMIVCGMREQSLEVIKSLDVGPLPPAKTPDAEDKYIASLLELLATVTDTYGPLA